MFLIYKMRAKGGRMEADKNKTQVHKRRVRYKGKSTGTQEKGTVQRNTSEKIQ